MEKKRVRKTPYKVIFAEVEPDLRDKLQVEARSEKRTMTKQLEFILQERYLRK